VATENRLRCGVPADDRGVAEAWTHRRYWLCRKNGSSVAAGVVTLVPAAGDTLVRFRLYNGRTANRDDAAHGARLSPPAYALGKGAYG